MFCRTPLIVQFLWKKIVWESPTGKLLFTFDDGPDPIYTLKFSELLQKYKYQGIFFVSGEQIKDKALLNEVRLYGHDIAWHGQTHRSFLSLPDKEVHCELQGVKRLEDCIGEKVTWFRFPYGRFFPKHIKMVFDQGMTPMMWSFMVSDYKPCLPSMLLKRLNGLRENDILLYHDRSPNAKNSFSALSEYLQKKMK